MAKKISNSSTFKMVQIQDLNVDPEAQRKLSVAWVKARKSSFDVDQLGYIVVNKRTGGKLFIVDGQHRVELMREVGWGDQNIHAEYFEGMDQAQEAAIFLARNDRKAVRTFDKFRVRITEGDPVATAINRIVQEHGLCLSDQLANGHIAAVDALERVYRGGGISSEKEGPKALSNVLDIIVKAWGNIATAVNGRVIQGIGLVELRYNGTLDQAALVKKLAPFPGGPSGILGRGRAMKETHGRSLPHCIASIVVDIYNKGRSKGKLEKWDS